MVCGEEKITYNVSKGDAVFWDQGEWHETVSKGGLTAIVIEGKELKPSLYMPVVLNK